MPEPKVLPSVIFTKVVDRSPIVSQKHVLQAN